ncbi:MAG: hypothetical protein ACRDJW_13170 [Thermomicrobiales bacterium]
MARFSWISRRIVIGLVVFALTLGGFLLQPVEALASYGSSGEHYPEATITSGEPEPLWWCRSWWCD